METAKLCPICTFPLSRAEDGDAHAGCGTWQAMKDRQHATGVQIAVDRLVPVIHHSEACGRGQTLERDDLGCTCGLWEALEQLTE